LGHQSLLLVALPAAAVSLFCPWWKGHLDSVVMGLSFQRSDRSVGPGNRYQSMIDINQFNNSYLRLVEMNYRCAAGLKGVLCY
jgi:hypothetical protein